MLEQRKKQLKERRRKKRKITKKWVHDSQIKSSDSFEVDFDDDIVEIVDCIEVKM